jgi:probable HAF family extracellular repeat protein
MKSARTNRANLPNSSVVAVVVAVGVALAVGVLSQQPGAQAQDATVAPSYTVKDLGTLGGPSSHAFGINDAGQVVGGASTSEGVSHAFLYDRNASPKMQDLGTLGGNYSEARSINDAGQVVGYSDTTNCSVAGCYTDYHAFLYERSATPQMQDLGTLGVGTQSGINNSFASGINDAGQVVGGASTSSDSYHAFLYERSATPQMQDLGTLGVGTTLGDNYSEARDINDAGQVVGLSITSSDSYHAFLYERSATPQMQDLGALGDDDYSEARGINDAGQVVGVSAPASSSSFYHAFLYERSASPKMQYLGTLGGNYSGAHDINDAGQVVGISTTSSDSFHAFLYDRSASPKMQDLNSLIRPHSGWSLVEALAINQRGQIVGLGERNGHNHAFLLTPRKKTL